uniref:ARAD1D30426p n=1 Tax=Blastobotrys adeninivorans TaxID=409370 RepID=A0A060THF0_BLAAD
MKHLRDQTRTFFTGSIGLQLVYNYRSMSNEDRVFKIPIARVKRIIKADEDITTVSTGAVYAIAAATELFTHYFAEQACLSAQADKRKKLNYSDFATAVQNTDQLEFLSDIVPKKIAYRKIVEPVTTNNQSNTLESAFKRAEKPEEASVTPAPGPVPGQEPVPAIIEQPGQMVQPVPPQPGHPGQFVAGQLPPPPVGVPLQPGQVPGQVPVPPGQVPVQPGQIPGQIPVPVGLPQPIQTHIQAPPAPAPAPTEYRKMPLFTDPEPQQQQQQPGNQMDTTE